MRLTNNRGKGSFFDEDRSTLNQKLVMGYGEYPRLLSRFRASEAELKRRI